MAKDYVMMSLISLMVANMILDNIDTSKMFWWKKVQKKTISQCALNRVNTEKLGSYEYIIIDHIQYSL